MKRIVSLLLVVLMMLAMTSAFADYTGTAPVFDEKVTLSILTANGASRRSNVLEMPWWQKVLENANVDIDLEIVDSSTYNDVAQPRLAAAQDLPDIMRIQANAASVAASGLFTPLNDLIEKYGYNTKKMFEKYPNLEAAITFTDGNIYFLPYIYTADSNYRTMILNKGYLDQLGLTMEDIKTTDDLYDYLVKVRDMDMNGNGDPSDEYPMFVRGETYMNVFAMYWGVDIPNTSGFSVKDGEVYCDYLTDDYKEFLQFVNKLYNENLINKDFLSANWDMQAAAYSEDAIGSTPDFISNAVDGSQLSTEGWDFYNDEPIYQIACLQNKYGEPVVYGRSVMGVNYGVTSFAKDPEAAFKFLDYMYSEEVGIQTWYGTEGVDYVKNGDKFEFQNEYLENKDTYRDNNGYNMDAFGGYQYDYSSAMSPMLGEQTRAYAAYTWNPSRLNKYYTEEQQDVLNTYLTDLKTYFSENATAFMLGTKSFDEWDAYIQGAKDMGVEQVIAVYQEAEQ